MTSENTADLPINQILPQTGELYYEPSNHLVLCQPHLIPLKSLNLSKLEELQKDAEKAWTEYKARPAKENE